METTIIPKKHFGQNFLKDSITLDKILQASSELYKSCSLELEAKMREKQVADAHLQTQTTRTLETKSSACATNADLILGQNKMQPQPLLPLQLVEIGVGLGDLSKRLLSIAPLIAYEIDEALCSFVLQRFEKENLLEHFDLRQVDVLSLPFVRHLAMRNLQNQTSWLSAYPYLLVSNLPYYIATRIILTALKDPLCVGFVVMTQKEVADKFCATSGDREFCALSVLAQSAGEIRFLFDVPKEAFNPAPKVTSSVFSLHKQNLWQNQTPNKQDLIRHYDFEILLKSAFASPRKRLFSNLAKQYDKSLIEQIFTTLNIAQDTRAHQLAKEDYHHIYQLIKDQQ